METFKITAQPVASRNFISTRSSLHARIKYFILMSAYEIVSIQLECNIVETPEFKAMSHISHVTTRPVFRVSDQVQHELGCTATGNGYRLEISDLGSTFYVVKETALISCAVTAQLICTFCFSVCKSQVFS